MPVPPALVSLAVNTFVPCCVSVTPSDHAPVEPTVAVPIEVEPSRSVTVEPASATSTVPVIVWLALVTAPPVLVIATVGAGGGGTMELSV